MESGGEAFPDRADGRKYGPLKSRPSTLRYMAEYRKRPEVIARQAAYMKVWRSAHPNRQRLCKGETVTEHWKHINDKRVEYQRMWHRAHILERYGLTLDDYSALLEKQGGKCAMPFCKRTRRLAVDHDHVTGRVRGLLCTPCNSFLGFFERNPNLVRQVRSYLKPTLRPSLVSIPSPESTSGSLPPAA